MCSVEFWGLVSFVNFLWELKGKKRKQVCVGWKIFLFFFVEDWELSSGFVVLYVNKRSGIVFFL